MITKTKGECPVCYGETEEESCYEWDPPYHEAYVTCAHKCYYEEQWCGNYRWMIVIRGHQISFGGWHDETQEYRRTREAAIEIVIKAARAALIEDLREKSKA